MREGGTRLFVKRKTSSQGNEGMDGKRKENESRRMKGKEIRKRGDTKSDGIKHRENKCRRDDGEDKGVR